MTPQRLHRGIQRELGALETQGVLTPQERARIGERYPAEPWNLLVLGRWFTLLGMVAMGAGVLTLLRHLEKLARPVKLAELGCLLGTAGLLWLARWLRTAKALEKTAAACELGAGFALQGLTVALAIDYSTGSDNWPALIGVNAALLTLLAYVLGNRLVLVHALVNFFVWFGGSTGYVSGWGAYWLGMTYPVRFLAVGLATLAVAWAHAHAPLLAAARRSFARVYAHFGLLITHFALWFLSVFGFFEDHVRWSGTTGQRLAFSALWAGVSVLCLVLAGRLGQRVLRSYGLVFLILDVYTFYFQFVVAHSAEAWFLHLLVTGGSLIAVGLWLEKQLRVREAP